MKKVTKIFAFAVAICMYRAAVLDSIGKTR